MVVGNRLKELRESKKLSQSDIQKRSGLLRFYISRVENGHTVPSVETLEKMARALDVPMYQLFHEGEVSESVRNLKLPRENDDQWGTVGRTADYFSKLRMLLAQMEPDERNLRKLRGAALPEQLKTETASSNLPTDLDISLCSLPDYFRETDPCSMGRKLGVGNLGRSLVFRVLVFPLDRSKRWLKAIQVSYGQFSARTARYGRRCKSR